jgi:hypothetical protein
VTVLLGNIPLSLYVMCMQFNTQKTLLPLTLRRRKKSILNTHQKVKRKKKRGTFRSPCFRTEKLNGPTLLMLDSRKLPYPHILASVHVDVCVCTLSVLLHPGEEEEERGRVERVLLRVGCTRSESRGSAPAVIQLPIPSGISFPDF